MREAKPISGRQREILQMAAEGHTDKEIARVIGLSEGTVRTYWDRMRARYQARSRSELINKVLLKAETPDLQRFMLLKLPLFVWTADPSGYVDFCNEWFTTQGGLDPQECLGQGCRALMPDDEKLASAARWRHATDTGEAYEAMVHFRCGPNGELRPHKIRLTPLRDSEGRVAKWIGYGRELAENADEQMVKFLRAMIS